MSTYLPIYPPLVLSKVYRPVKCILVQDVNDLLDHSNAELSDKLSRIGDNIVVKLVQWTRRLPFYEDIPVNIHTSLLTNKWHELLVLTTSSYQAIHGGSRMGTTRSDGETAEHHQEVSFLTGFLRSEKDR